MAKIEKNEIYEGNVNEVETQDLIPVDVDEANDDGPSTGAVVLLTAAATAGLIWLVDKAVKWNRNRKAKKASAAATEEEISECDIELAEDFEEA